MASSTQSAVDYIKQARIHLVRELTNLSVIVENLHQQGVLHDAEVSDIQEEPDDYYRIRTILDKVMNKGEEACNKLLRIIDVTRKRTLGRPSLLPGKMRVASTETEKFDLHHWISCFPFEEDIQTDINYSQGPRPCCRYQAQLKSKALNMSNAFWAANKNLFDKNKPDLSYTSLVLDTEENVSPYKIKKLKSKKSKMSRPKKMRTYIPKDRSEISPHDLLKTDRNIVLVGKPGIGKTALTHEMMRLWAERDSEELDYMFYFDMRETSYLMKDMNLEHLLFSVFSEPDEDKDEVFDEIKKNSDNVTVIFDGITDQPPLVVQRLVEKELLPYAKIIITCRLDDEKEDFFSGDFVRVEVKGFSEQSIKTYLSATLGENQKKVVSNLELFTLCYVPVYALMVAACFSSDVSPQPCTTTEIYIEIVRFWLQMKSNTKKKDLISYIRNQKEEILALADIAFCAVEGKTVNLTERPCEEGCVLSFLNPLVIKVGHTETKISYAFLHYTMQEFFAAVWLLKNPEKVKDVFQQSLTAENKHMKHLIPFMCGLLNEKSPSLMKCLIPAEELKKTSDCFFKEMIDTFFDPLCEQDEADTEDSRTDVDILFLCQCLYESQCPEACSYLLNKLDYCLDLREQSLDPYSCCAVAYVVAESKERKILLNLEDVTVSKQGIRQLFGCLPNVQWCDPLPRQLWQIFLLSEEQMDYVSLLVHDRNQLHLPVEGRRRLFERAVEVLQKIPMKVNVCLHWDRPTPVCPSLCVSLLEALPHINSLSFRMIYRDPGSQEQERCHGKLQEEEKRLLLDLCLTAALHKKECFLSVVNMLMSLFPINNDLNNFLLDLYQHVKICCSSVIPELRQLFHSTPSVWFIDLSERKTSVLLEVLKLQSEKKHIVLTDCSHDESEVRSFLQCLPYISQLSLSHWFRVSDQTKFFVNLFSAAAEREQQTGEKILQLLSSVCEYNTFPFEERNNDNDLMRKHQCDFLLELFTHMKESETKTGLSLLPALQSVFQSAPSGWFIDLSERKTSVLLEVLKLQPEKKQVKLTGWSHGEIEVRSFLQCLPYISQLSFPPWFRVSDQAKFFGILFSTAAEREQQTGEKTLELLSSVCGYNTFPFQYIDNDLMSKYQCRFLLDLFAHVKDSETKTGLSVLPALQSVFQSAPSVWLIDLSEGKTSVLLEVLKLQSEKKQVKLTGWSHEESEVTGLPQCLPYISQLSLSHWFRVSDQTKFFGILCSAAAERQQQTGEKTLQLLSSVCGYNTFPFQYIDNDLMRKHQCDFLLELFVHMKESETKTGLSLLPALQSVFQSAPSVWLIDLSEKKTSVLLEVLKLQLEKKHVELTGWPHGEIEVRSFLQCLPYISQLKCVLGPCSLPEASMKSTPSHLKDLCLREFCNLVGSVDCELETLRVNKGVIQTSRDKPCDSTVKLEPNTADTMMDVSDGHTSLMMPRPSFTPELLIKSTDVPYRVNKGVIQTSSDKPCDSTVKLEPNTADTMMDVCDDHTTLMMMPPSSFTPELITESTDVSYRFRCPDAGGFKCNLTGLVFVMAKEGMLLYRTVQWDENLLLSAGKMAAGPLFEIQCPEVAVCQLHLPHCETNETLRCQGLLSVIHITSHGMSVIEPMEITDTHVVVKVPHLSGFVVAWDLQTLWKFWKDKPITGQILLFLRQPNPKTQRQNLNVLLLPSNVPLKEVKAKHKDSVYLKVPPKCKLIKDQYYTIHCQEAYKVQPPREQFELDFGPNFHPMFEIRLPTNTDEANITIKDQANAVVWERDIELNGPRKEMIQWTLAEDDNVQLEDNLTAEDKLLLIRRKFVERVSQSVVNQLLDKLLEKGFVNDEEIQTAKSKTTTDAARELIDNVRKRGTKASLNLIAALCKFDPSLAKVLQLKLNESVSESDEESQF